MDKKLCNKGSCLKIDGCSLNLIAASTANAFSHRFTIDELNVLAVFFTVLGDALETFAAVNALNCPEDENNDAILPPI